MSKLLRSLLIIALVGLFNGVSSYAQVVADFTASPTSGCAPLSVSFSDASTGGVTSWSWNLGVGSPVTTQNASIIYTTPGVYNVTLTASGSSGSDTKTIPITVYGKPSFSFSSTPSSGCVPLSVQFGSAVTTLNAPGSPTYYWDFGDGFSSPAANPGHTYTSAGNYSVSLKVTNGAGCDTTILQTNMVTVYPKPVPSFVANQTNFCAIPSTVTFVSLTSGTGLTYDWRFGDGGFGTGSPTSHTYNSGGLFDVFLKVTDSHGCKDSATVLNYINVDVTPANFTAPTADCQDNLVNFLNTTPNATSTTWAFGDLGIGGGAAAAHTYATAGTYTVTMTTTVGVCTKVKTKNIVINPRPSASFTYQPLYPCPPYDSLVFTSTSTGGAAYQWKWSGGGGTGSPITRFYPAKPKPVNYYIDTVTLIVTSSAGCRDSFTIDTIYIRDIVVDVTASPEQGCAPLPVSFGANILTHLPKPPSPFDPLPPYPPGAATYTWDFGDNTTGTGATPTHTYTIGRRDYTVKLVITTPNGCIDSGFKTVHVDSPVHPQFTVSPLTVCPRVPITFTNNTIHQVGTTYFWDLGDTAFTKGSNLNPFTYGYKKPGVYTIKLYTNHNGCIDTLIKKDSVTINPSNAEFSQVAACSPSLAVQFTDLSIGATSYLWLFGDGTTSTLPSPNHTFPAATIYYDTLTTYNNVYGCRDTFIKKVDLTAPLLFFQASDDTICRNATAHFTGGATSPYTMEYSYQIGSFNSPFDPNPTFDYTFTTSGLYTVKLTARGGPNNACVYNITKTNYILVSQPVVSFTSTPPIGCKPISVTFTDNSTFTPGTAPFSRTWDFDDGSNPLVNNLSTVTHAYPNKGTYAVKLIVQDNQGCKDSSINVVEVRKPVAAFSVSDDTVCVNQPIIISNTSSGATGLFNKWQFGDGDTSILKNPIHAYKLAGTYTMRLIVKDSTGCGDTLTKIILVSGPHASFTKSDSVTICKPPLTVNFDASASTGASAYNWDFGNGSGPVLKIDPVTTFPNYGKFIIRLIVTDLNGCSDTAFDSVKVLGYNGSFSYTPTNICVGQSVSFNGNIANIPKYRWDFDDGSTDTASGQLVTHTYSTPGSYIPKLVYSDGGSCNAVSLGLTAITVDKLSTDFSWTVPCVGVPFTLTDNSTALFAPPNTWSWNFGSGPGATSASTTYTYATSGNHPVKLVISNSNGCKDSITKNVFINPLPLVDAGPDQGICPNDSTLLIATGAVHYEWSPDSILICMSPPNCDTVKVWKALPTTYYVTGTDANGCVNKDSVRAFIQIKTETNVGKGGEICAGESFQLNASGATRYSWTPAASLNNANISNPIATPLISTTYILEAQKGTCLIAFDTVKVTVHELPLFDAGLDETINLGSSVTLHARKTGIDHIIWKQDTTLSCLTCFDPVAKPYYTRIYYATGYDEFGCSATDSVRVIVRCNGSLVFIPNTFTPNGDGNNDYFFPRGEGVGTMASFRIYNRWGELVFERNNMALNDEHSGWDGTYKGQPLAPDVYMYTMQARCEDGKPVEWKGDITLIR